MTALLSKTHLARLSRLGRLGQPKTAESASSDTPPKFRLTAKRGLLLIYVVLLSLVALTWTATADIVIDFGRELYVPWQLAEGKTLYRDIAYFNGPLSPHFNALMFRLFGDSVTTLVVTNTVLLAALVTMLYALLLRYFSVVTSTLACGCMLILFGVVHMSPQGNYNYITPYSHELTHGLLLAIAMLSLLGHEAQFRLWKWALVGLLWGLVFLGKAELFLASTAMLGFSLLLPLLAKQVSVRQAIFRAGAAAGFAAIPILGFWIWLGSQTGPAEAAMNLLGSWRYIFTSEVTSLFYYRQMTGTLAPLWNMTLSARFCVATAFVMLGLYMFERNIGGRGWRNPAAAFSLVFAFYLSAFTGFVLYPRAFFVITATLFLTLLYLAMKRREDFLKYHHLACWAAFAVCLMAKIVLRPILGLYGFALLMPAVVLAIAIAVEWLPRVMSGGGTGKRFRLALILLLLLDVTLILARTTIWSSEKSYVVGSGPDRMRCDEWKGVPFQAATEYLADRMTPDETLLVLPEGVTLNYLLRRGNNSRYVNFMQPELVMYGEAKMLADFKRNPCDYVLLVSRDLKEGYGLYYFGQPGYGDQIMNWVRANYVVEKQFGADPFQPEDFGIQILRRRLAPAVTSHSAMAQQDN